LQSNKSPKGFNGGAQTLMSRVVKRKTRQERERKGVRKKSLRLARKPWKVQNKKGR